MGKPSIELKAGDYAKHIPSGVALLKGLNFHNGTIEYDVATDNGMGAGFIFRRADKDNFEEFYLRPRPRCQEDSGLRAVRPADARRSAVGSVPAISGSGSAA
jgi:hypothetical protein